MTIITNKTLTYFHGACPGSGTGGVATLGGLTHSSKCVFESLLCKDIRTPILDVYLGRFCLMNSVFCFLFVSLEGSLNVVI